jgi:putative protease
LKIYGDYTLNLLNSQAVRAARELGVALPQIAVETDAGNAGEVLDHAPRPLFFTVFAWIPLFTSRLCHSSYAPARPVSSMRDEVFYWQKGNGAWVLLPHRPFSLIRRRQELEAMGFSALVVDLTNWPLSRKIRKKQGGRFNIMDILSRGREFNFSGKLW